MLLDLNLWANSLRLHHVSIVMMVVIVVYLIFQRYKKGLSRYPGPFVASFTNCWRTFDVWKRDTHTTFRTLHRKYGEVVRVAPNVLSFGHPDAIEDIYGLNKGYTKVRDRRSPCYFPAFASNFEKSGYYDVFATVNKGNIVYNL